MSLNCGKNLDKLLASDVYHCVIVLPSGSGLWVLCYIDCVMVSGFCLCSVEGLGEWMKNTAVTRWEYLHLERRNAVKPSDDKITRKITY